MAFKDTMNSIGEWAKNNSNPLIALGGSILSNITNNFAQKKSADRQMDFQRESYQIQRNDALADREHEEQFNSPIQQSQRLREAGMSPMDYMGDPVSTSTRDSGSAGEGSAPDMRGLFDGIGQLGEMAEQRRQFNMQMKEQKRVNDSIIDLNNANADKSRGDNRRGDVKLGLDVKRFDNENAEFSVKVRGMNIDNAQKSALLDHSKVMYGYEEKIAAVDSEVAEKTKSAVVSQASANVKLTNAHIAEIGQIMAIKGPDEALAKLTEVIYGQRRSDVVSMCEDQLSLDKSSAAVAAAEMALKEGIVTDESGRSFAHSVWEFFFGAGVATNGSRAPESAVRGSAGAVLKAILK